MKLPKEIRTRHKLRDAAIVKLYAQDNLNMEKIGERYHISRNRVSQILYDNKHLLLLDKAFEKAKRIHFLKKHITNDSYSKKDPADLLEQIRVEIEGEKSIIDQSSHNHYVIFRNPDAIREESQVSQLQTR